MNWNLTEIAQSKTRIVCGSHVCKCIKTKWAISIEDLPWILLTKFHIIWWSDNVTELCRKHLWKSPLLRLLISFQSVNKHGHHRQFLFLIDLFLKIFSETAKTCLWQPYLLLDRDEMSNLYRGHSIDASYHLAKRFQRFLEIDKSETRIACKKIPLNPPRQIIRSLVGSIYGRSSIKIVHSVPVH
jgi:hypothetical protein